MKLISAPGNRPLAQDHHGKHRDSEERGCLDNGRAASSLHAFHLRLPLCCFLFQAPYGFLHPVDQPVDFLPGLVDPVLDDEVAEDVVKEDVQRGRQVPGLHQIIVRQIVFTSEA